MNKRLEIDVSIADDGWTSALDDIQDQCRNAASAAFDIAAPADLENAEVSILLTDDAQLHDLNKKYRGKDKPTNVLSFASMDEGKVFSCGPVLLGDVIIAFGVSLGESQSEGKSLGDHLSHLVIHGMLHLLGHDHEIAEEAEKMENLEIQILAGLGINDPYKETDLAGMG
ncbi:MAG: rRNA maturation RNase YbeY [Rhodospirillales bacterium]|nr:rRNA maturation RNase YbeY [Rhodospirillales bacterium]